MGAWRPLMPRHARELSRTTAVRGETKTEARAPPLAPHEQKQKTHSNHRFVSHAEPRELLSPPLSSKPSPNAQHPQAVALAEKKRLKDLAARKAELFKKMQEEETAGAGAGGATARRDRNRLAFLTRQAELFQHFAPGAYAEAGGGGGAAGGGAAAPGGKKGKGGGGNKGKGRRARDEADEDAELLRDEDDGGERAGHRLQVQPSCLSGGTLREYQMQGLNWLIHLYDTGINGILADEMVRSFVLFFVFVFCLFSCAAFRSFRRAAAAAAACLSFFLASVPAPLSCASCRWALFFLPNNPAIYTRTKLAKSNAPAERRKKTRR